MTRRQQRSECRAVVDEREDQSIAITDFAATDEDAVLAFCQ
jgi:hypothetical protein